MAISKAKRDKIVAQALQEISFARQYKQGRIWNWQRNEQMYYALKYPGLGTFPPLADLNTLLNQNAQLTAGGQQQSASIELGKMASYVATYLSKIDTPLTFEFKKSTMADLQRAQLMNALKDRDSNLGDWQMKDLLGKKQMIIYGRAIYGYYAESEKEYISRLSNLDVYRFLIDPSGGGWDLDLASYMGDYTVRLWKSQLKKGAASGIYIKSEVDRLVTDGSGNDSETTQEKTNEQNRYAYTASPANRVIGNTDIYDFWRWCTTFEGQRYYLLLQETGACAIRCELLADLFKVDPMLGDANWPYWSYAAIPDLTEFWTPSPCDYVREVFMAENLSIGQMLDNSERINNPQKRVDVTSVVNLADLPYRRNGIIRFKSGTDVNKSFQPVITASIDTPLKVYQALDQIAQIESGVTDAAKGAADEDKVGIYQGNQAATADLFNLINKSYSFGYKRFAKLYVYGVDMHLTKKVVVKILGPDGLEKTAWVGKRDVKPQAEYELVIKSSNAETEADTIDKKNKLTALTNVLNNQLLLGTINVKEAIELQFEIAGFDPAVVKQLMDTSDFASADLIAKCERDIEDLLNGKDVEPNPSANTAYAQHLLNYMQDHKEDMDTEERKTFVKYFDSIQPIVMDNMVRQLQNQMAKQAIRTPGTAPGGNTLPNNQTVTAAAPVQTAPPAQAQPYGQ